MPSDSQLWGVARGVFAQLKNWQGKRGHLHQIEYLASQAEGGG